MKLTTEQVEYLRNNKSFKNEGIVARIFAYVLKKRLKNSPDFKTAVDNADKAMDELKNQLLHAERNGVIIPDELKKYAGLK